MTSINLSSQDKHNILSFTKKLSLYYIKTNELNKFNQELQAMENQPFKQIGRSDLINHLEQNYFLGFQANLNSNMIDCFKNDLSQFIINYLLAQYLPKFVGFMGNDVFNRSEDLNDLCDIYADTFRTNNQGEEVNLKDYLSISTIDNPTHIFEDLSSWWENIYPNKDIIKKSQELNNKFQKMYEELVLNDVKAFVKEYSIIKVENNKIIFSNNQDPESFLEDDLKGKISSLFYYLQYYYGYDFGVNPTKFNKMLIDIKTNKLTLVHENKCLKEMQWQIPYNDHSYFDFENTFITYDERDALKIANILKNIK
ncbi:hypothetical protein DY052_06360 [Apilactobacillus timberlakei]|uniref:hypothetical protein n=1 Tax=Apilactobacillus timberlakei TaxID=2008380 RepID=UPI00112D5C63|nr:hypothetical protein [Apilactobacillus timberlakei]TPR15047.1 hypothetical protein DY052_06360 [Apilactobacillus timberlakei]